MVTSWTISLLIFIKDWKKKQKPEEPDVDIPLVEPEPLGEMKL